MSSQVLNIDDYPEFSEFSAEEGWVITPFCVPPRARRNPAPYGEEYYYTKEDAFLKLPDIKKTVLKALSKGGLRYSPSTGGGYSIAAMKLRIRTSNDPDPSSWVAMRGTPPRWKRFDIAFMNAEEKRSNVLGFCASNRKTGEIALRFCQDSFQKLPPRSRLQVILHECAHMLDHVFSFLDLENGHNSNWLKITRELGCFDCAESYDSLVESVEHSDVQIDDIDIGSRVLLKDGTLLLVVDVDPVQGFITGVTVKDLFDFRKIQVFHAKSHKPSPLSAAQKRKISSFFEKAKSGEISFAFFTTLLTTVLAEESGESASPRAAPAQHAPRRAAVPSAAERIAEDLESWLTAAKAMSARKLANWDLHIADEAWPIAFESSRDCFLFFTGEGGRFRFVVEDFGNDTTSKPSDSAKAAVAWIKCFPSEKEALRSFKDSFETP